MLALPFSQISAIETISAAETQAPVSAEPSADTTTETANTCGDNVVSVGDGAFRNCDSLTKITVSKNMQTDFHFCTGGCNKV